MQSKNHAAFIAALPKAELHLHIEGTLEPEMMFQLASRNNISLPYPSIETLHGAYRFSNLQSFLDLYYAGMEVLRTEVDFYDLARAYLKKMTEENTRHVEVFFDPQAHSARGITMDTLLNGLRRGFEEYRVSHGISYRFIPNFLRHLSAEAAMDCFEKCLPYRDWIAGFGLDSSERNNPPSKFKAVFERIRAEGFHIVAHAGEEGPPSYIWESLDILKAERIDHGIQSINDVSLLIELEKRQIPLTICPLSNDKLNVVSDLASHPLGRLMKAGIMVTINSDDPAYFGGYLSQNYLAIIELLRLSRKDILQIVKNGFLASFLPMEEKRAWSLAVDAASHAFMAQPT